LGFKENKSSRPINKTLSILSIVISHTLSISKSNNPVENVFQKCVREAYWDKKKIAFL
jgi:hypothetical protein